MGPFDSTLGVSQGEGKETELIGRCIHTSVPPIYAFGLLKKIRWIGILPRTISFKKETSPKIENEA